MGIITEKAEVIPSGKNIQHYRDLGYDVKWHKPLIVSVNDLTKGSNAQVEVLCDMCHKNKMTVPYEVYNRVVSKTGNYVCKECAYIKNRQTNLKRYGVPVASQSEDIKELMKQTNLERYGVDNYAKTQEYNDKIRQTCLDKYNVEHFSQLQEVKNKREVTNVERYGVKNVSQVAEFKEKVFNTNIERYGTKYASSSSEIKEKIKQTNLKKFGVPHVMQSYEIRTKISNSLYKNGNVSTSKQQLYLFNIFKSTNKDVYLNFPISYYNVDICFQEERFIIEYNGSGHDLQVKLVKLTQEEFNQKEIIRNNVIKKEGYKQMRIISSNDKLPQDDILLQMLSEARTYFATYPSHSWYEFNISTSTVRNAENLNGIPYDFGALRTIKDNDIQNQSDIEQQTTKKGA